MDPNKHVSVYKLTPLTSTDSPGYTAAERFSGGGRIKNQQTHNRVLGKASDYTSGEAVVIDDAKDAFQQEVTGAYDELTVTLRKKLHTILNDKSLDAYTQANLWLKALQEFLTARTKARYGDQTVGYKTRNRVPEVEYRGYTDLAAPPMSGVYREPQKLAQNTIRDQLSTWRPRRKIQPEFVEAIDDAQVGRVLGREAAAEEGTKGWYEESYPPVRQRERYLTDAFLDDGSEDDETNFESRMGNDADLATGSTTPSPMRTRSSEAAAAADFTPNKFVTRFYKNADFGDNIVKIIKAMKRADPDFRVYEGKIMSGDRVLATGSMRRFFRQIHDAHDAHVHNRKYIGPRPVKNFLNYMEERKGYRSPFRLMNREALRGEGLKRDSGSVGGSSISPSSSDTHIVKWMKY
jgi:hypothetical protein